MKNNRFVKRSSFSYSTKSNKIRVIRTPGNRLNTLNMIKKKSSRTCSIEKTKINGLTIPGSRRYSNLSKKNKTISRPYGGCLSIHALKKNIIKAFLIEEKKLAKKVLRLNKKKIQPSEKVV